MGRRRGDAGLTAAVALTAIAAEAAIVVASKASGDHTATLRVAGSVTTGLLFVFCGLVARHRTPYARMGWLLVLAGALWMSEDLSLIDTTFGDAVSRFTGQASSLGFTWAALAFPTGRLRGAVDRWLLGTVAFEVFVLRPGTVLADICACTPGRVDLVNTLEAATLVAGVALFCFRLSRSTRPERRMITPFLAAGVVIALVNLAKVALNQGNLVGDFLPLSFSLGPLGVLAGLTRVRIVRIGITSVVREIGTAGSLHQVSAALRRSLGDRNLAIRVREPESGEWLDEDGREMMDLAPAPGGTVTPIADRDGNALGALVHDPALAHDPELLHAVVTAIRLALENAALHDAVSAELARSATAVDGERRRVARDLHDGAQQRLVTLMFNVQTLGYRLGDSVTPEIAEMLAVIQDNARDSLADLRRLVHGLAPATLVEEGLGGALQEMALGMPVMTRVDDRLPGRLPEAVESGAYLMVAEALANVAKHAGASAVLVSLELQGDDLHVAVSDDGCGGAGKHPGAGIAGLHERASTLGGSVTIESPEGHGTTVGIWVPAGGPGHERTGFRRLLGAQADTGASL